MAANDCRPDAAVLLQARAHSAASGAAPTISRNQGGPGAHDLHLENFDISNGGAELIEASPHAGSRLTAPASPAPLAWSRQQHSTCQSCMLFVPGRLLLRQHSSSRWGIGGVGQGCGSSVDCTVVCMYQSWYLWR